MANPSIFAAFERMWQHIVLVLSGKADSKHTHDTSDLSGAMPIAKGGTNATTAEDARTNLGIPTIHSGTAAPSSSLGKDGDIYIQYTE
jgi:hypothetical protein